MHRFLTPKLNFLRNFRVNLRTAGYQKSHLLRYLEEALAETYAQLKVHGIKGLPTGIKFPVKNGYVRVSQVLAEGWIATVVVGGTTFGVYFATRDTESSKPSR